MRPTPIVIKEYEEAVVTLDSAQHRTLRKLAGPHITILPGDNNDSWRIKASSFVGTVVTPDIRLLIKPKVSTANLFHLLEARGRPLALGPSLFDYDTTDDLVPAFATFFASHMEACLSHGITRQYEQTEGELSTIRGRIDLPGQMRRTGLPLPIACRFDEYTADTALNRLVKGATLRLSRFPGSTLTTRQSLLQLLGRLEEVGSLRIEDIRRDTVFNRLNEHYRLVERLARLVLDQSSLLDASGSTGAAVFLIDMNKVFEEFIEQRLRRYLAGRLTVRGQLSLRLDVDGHVGMRPDLIFQTSGGLRAYVADSKYKLTADGYGRESDYYQLLAYTTALRLPEGLLIYCQHDGAAPSREVHVGPDAKRLTTRAVRLDRSIAHVEDTLRLLADEIAERTKVPMDKLTA